MNIEEIKARAELATPGPWYWDVVDAQKFICLESARWKVMDFARYGMNGAAPRFLVDGIMERADSLLKSIPGKEHHRGFDNYIDHPDAQFIAHAREDIPALIAEVERLEVKCAKCTNDETIDSTLAIMKAQRTEIDDLKITVAAYRAAEEQGLLVRLPCKVGDTVYTVSGSRIQEALVDYISMDKKIFVGVSFECDNDCTNCYFSAWKQGQEEWDCDNAFGSSCIEASDFGKTVFLTREEAAEELLKEGEGEMSGHICSGIAKDCYNPMDSYGEICVHCNCCGRIDKSTMHQCRIETDKRHLLEDAQKMFDEDFQTPFQQKNILTSIEWYIRRIQESEAEIAKEDTDDK